MIPGLEWWDILARIAVAAALTGAIGLERELRERAAGLRTHMLVGVGSALFTIVSAYAWTDFGFSTRSGVVFDPTRIAAQVVTGIGFLGAGAIIRQGLSIRGLTTAAGLWVVAAIGMAAGVGYYSAALIATGLVLLGLGPLRPLGDSLLARLRRGARVLEIDVVPSRQIGGVLAAIERPPVRLQRVEFGDAEGGRRLRIELELPSGGEETRLVSDLAALDDVTAVRWVD